MTDYTPEQIAANRAKWLEALRSGNYRQGQSSLRVRDSFCCLGVACDLHDNSRWEHGSGSYDTLAFFPPSDVLESFGLPGAHDWGIYGIEGSHDSLTAHVAKMNDAGKSFAEIADFLEQEFSK